MKRLYPAIILIAIILGVSVFTMFQCRQFYQESTHLLSDLMEQAESGRLEQAAALAVQFNDYWDQMKNDMVWYIRHEPLERITDISSRLEYLARYDDRAQLLAQTNELLTCVRELYDNELPLVRNLV